MTTWIRAGLLGVGLVVATAGTVAAHDWNAGGMAWRGLDEGLALAKKTATPVCLVIFTEGCPHCANYAKVFHDPKVVDRAKKFVMVHVDQDAAKAEAQKYAPDGGYIPRTLFLAPDGTVAADVHAPRDKYLYFYDENDPASILAGMDAALAKLAPKKK